MKRPFLLLLFFVFVNSNFAQTNSLLCFATPFSKTTVSSTDNFLMYKKFDCDHYAEMKKKGKILIIVGVPTAVVGLAALIVESEFQEHLGLGTQLAISLTAGAVYATGMALTLSGTGIYLYGKIMTRKHCRPPSSFQLKTLPGGLGLVYSF